MVSVLKKKLSSKKGFTLAELLIVVGIIAILVAIALPAFTASKEKAEEAVAKANCRSALAEATVKYLSDETAPDKVTIGGVDYTVSVSGDVVTVTGDGYTCSSDAPTPTTAP